MHVYPVAERDLELGEDGLHRNGVKKLSEVLIIDGGDFQALCGVQEGFHGEGIDNEDPPPEKPLAFELFDEEALQAFQHTGA